MSYKILHCPNNLDIKLMYEGNLPPLQLGFAIYIDPNQAAEWSYDSEPDLLSLLLLKNELLLIITELSEDNTEIWAE